MFKETPSGSAFRPVVFLVHQVLAPIALGIAIAILPHERPFWELFCFSSGLPLGALVAVYQPEYAAEGRWIWVAPVVFFSGVFIHDIFLYPAGKVFADSFLGEPAQSPKTYELSLVALSIWGLCLYSVGVAVMMRKTRRASPQSETEGTSGPKLWEKQ